MSTVELQSRITCPECGHVKEETMPTDACLWFYECEGCGVVLRAQIRRLLRVLFLWHGQMPAGASRARLVL